MDTLTPQQIFDKVATHLLTQKRKADEGGWKGCCYKTESGLKCAVGCLIPDEAYETRFKSFEGWRVIRWTDEQLAICGLAPYHLNLLRDLQGLHDVDAVESWASGLRGLAFRHSLNADIIKTLEA